jgi:hypothetical protein
MRSSSGIALAVPELTARPVAATAVPKRIPRAKPRRSIKSIRCFLPLIERGPVPWPPPCKARPLVARGSASRSRFRYGRRSIDLRLTRLSEAKRMILAAFPRAGSWPSPQPESEEGASHADVPSKYFSPTPLASAPRTRYGARLGLTARRPQIKHGLPPCEDETGDG